MTSSDSWQKYEDGWNHNLWTSNGDSNHFDFDSEDSEPVFELQYLEGGYKNTKLLDENKKKNQELANNGRFPKSVFFIIGNEFCERFSYYGLRAVLTLYLKSVLDYNNHEAIELYHGFIFVCYFMPIFGAILADGFIGKYRTIFYISIIYAIGNVILAIASIGPLHLPTQAFSILGLGLIAVGTGGIKPCVSTFGGDQFEPNQVSQLEKFFSVFYFAINAGSLISMFITPILRADVKCFGEDSCFPLAFGVPAVLMVVSLILFIVGKIWYKIRPAEGTVIIDFFKCIFHAIGKKISSKSKKDHWLDHAEDKFDHKFIKDTKAVVHVLKLFIPIPFFWALFDQLGSRWIIQATSLNGRIPGTSYYILPDQMGTINPILILLFIPLFEYVIYPVFQKIGLLKKPLQKMCIGGFLAALAYVIAGFLQLKIEVDLGVVSSQENNGFFYCAMEGIFDSYYYYDQSSLSLLFNRNNLSDLPALPTSGFTQLRFINAVPCNITIKTEFMSTNLEHNDFHLTSADTKAGSYNIIVKSTDCPNLLNAARNFTENFESEKVYSLIIGLDRKYPTDKFELTLVKAEDVIQKSDSGKSLLRNDSFFVTSDKDAQLKRPNTISNHGSTEFETINTGSFKLYLPENLNKKFSNQIFKMDVGPGSIIRLVVTSNPNSLHPHDVTTAMYTIINTNTLHIALQLPQYFVITAAEIMLSITGLQFSYSQAPKAMKTVLSAAWLLTVSFGNCIVLIMELIGTLPKPSQEYFLFAAIMAADMILLSILAYFYKYVKYEDLEENHEDPKNDTNTTSL
ncbi:Solute carrier family 15 member 1 [Nymphon striatum]|nr:Solute carrier family 15 member 1 [Nymphon striatum]